MFQAAKFFRSTVTLDKIQSKNLLQTVQSNRRSGAVTELLLLHCLVSDMRFGLKRILCLYKTPLWLIRRNHFQDLFLSVWIQGEKQKSWIISQSIWRQWPCSEITPMSLRIQISLRSASSSCIWFFVCFWFILDKKTVQLADTHHY